MARQKTETCLMCSAPRWRGYTRCQKHQQEQWRRNKTKNVVEKSAEADFTAAVESDEEKLLLLDEETKQAWRVVAIEQHVVGRVLNTNTIGILEHQGYRVMRVRRGNESSSKA